MFNLEDKDSARRFSVFQSLKDIALLSIFEEFVSSISSYYSDRKIIFSYFNYRIKKLSKKLNFIKSSVFQKFYWGRGSLYKPIFTLLLISIFAFSFYMIGFLYNIGGAKHIKVATLSANAYSKGIISSSSALPSNTTKSKISADYGLVNWYKVEPGDTLASIAKKFNTSVSVIQWSNNLKTTNIYTGEALNIIPISGITYTVAPGDTLASIASKFSTSTTEIEDWNLLNNSTIATSPLTTGEVIFIPNAIISTPVSQNSTNNNGGISQTPTVASNFSNFSNTYIKSNISAKTAPILPQDYYYSQTNPAWAYTRLGYSGYDIAEVGCLVSSVAMIAKYYGYNITPQDIAQNPGNFSGPLFNWNGLGIFNVIPLGSLYGGYVNWTQINSELASGHPIVVSVDYAYHYVVLIKQLANGEYLMNDPAHGPNLIFNDYYSPSSVTQAVLFTPSD